MIFYQQDDGYLTRRNLMPLRALIDFARLIIDPGAGRHEDLV